MLFRSGVPSSNPHNHSGFFWETDRPGIEEIQKRLSITQDGEYGLQTQAHVISFQRGTGTLKVDGLTGPLTWSKLF